MSRPKSNRWKQARTSRPATSRPESDTSRIRKSARPRVFARGREPWSRRGIWRPARRELALAGAGLVSGYPADKKVRVQGDWSGLDPRAGTIRPPFPAGTGQAAPTARLRALDTAGPRAEPNRPPVPRGDGAGVSSGPNGPLARLEHSRSGLSCPRRSGLSCPRRSEQAGRGALIPGAGAPRLAAPRTPFLRSGPQGAAERPPRPLSRGRKFVNVSKRLYGPTAGDWESGRRARTDRSAAAESQGRERTCWT